MLPNLRLSPIAGGLCPQGATGGDIFPGELCTITNGGAGVWLVTVDDESARDGNCILIPSPGSGSNLPEGISFGQSQQQGRVFLFTAYRNDTGLAVDLPVAFVIFKVGS